MDSTRKNRDIQNNWALWDSNPEPRDYENLQELQTIDPVSESSIPSKSMVANVATELSTSCQRTRKKWTTGKTGTTFYRLSPHRDGWVKSIGGRTVYVCGKKPADEADRMFEVRFPEQARAHRAKGGFADHSGLLGDAKELSVTTRPCIYFLLLRGSIVYVGQTRHLFSRIGAHLLQKKFDSFRYIECRLSMLDIEEARWILRLRPPLNSINVRMISLVAGEAPSSASMMKDFLADPDTCLEKWGLIPSPKASNQ